MPIKPTRYLQSASSKRRQLVERTHHREVKLALEPRLDEGRVPRLKVSDDPFHSEIHCQLKLTELLKKAHREPQRQPNSLQATLLAAKRNRSFDFEGFKQNSPQKVSGNSDRTVSNLSITGTHSRTKSANKSRPLVTKIPPLFSTASREHSAVSPLFSNRRLTPKCNQSPIKFIRDLASPFKEDLSYEAGCITFRPDESCWINPREPKRFPHEVFRVKAMKKLC